MNRQAEVFKTSQHRATIAMNGTCYQKKMSIAKKKQKKTCYDESASKTHLAASYNLNYTLKTCLFTL